MKRLLYILSILALASCSEVDDLFMTETQQDLIGSAVNFSATKAEEFKQQTRTTYNDTGVFNENDLMRIYRQYAKDDGSGWDTQHEAYRTYYFNTKYATGTTISLGTDWRVYPGRKGQNADGTVINSQTEADSITWENGKTVRFRSWTRSNYANAVSGCYKYKTSEVTNYYPDYCISDWVTVSGPTEKVPLTMRHICSRIAISYRNNGSQFYKVELATDWHDYKRQDNADTSANDNGTSEAGKTDEEAQRECGLVLAAYNRMCMPAGVDIAKGELYAMTKAFWDPLDYNDTDNKKLRELENEAPSTFYHFGGDNNDYISKKVMRPLFGNVNQSCYLVTIPYDMSNEATQGDIITLPACTRFRVYLRDVNNGDGHSTSGYEGTYHIFSLSDIKDSDNNPKFPHGLDMLPGYSYKFYVGYRYDQLTITANDNFSWTEQELEEDNLKADEVDYPKTNPEKYTWWKNTIKNAIPTDGGDFNPVFHIKSDTAFIEFINLINNTAAIKTDGLYRAKRKEVNPDHADNAYDKNYWWYNKVSDNKRDTTWVTSEEATQMGYILYESYHAANANQPAYSQEEYLRGAYSFYDETRDRHYTVHIDTDIDLKDWKLPSIGKESTTPFQGYLDGYWNGAMHTLTNVNMEEEYLFKYIDAAAIRNLKIETTHKLSLVKEGTNTCYIVGVSLLAHSSGNPIAERLTTNSYNNPSYVVGCIHVGDAGGALVGATGNLYMYGCMQAAEGIPSGTGALVGTHLAYNTDNQNWKFLAPQINFNYTNGKAEKKGTPTWSRFMCNYFDTELSPSTWAVGDASLSATKDYSPLEYIRGGKSFILKAKDDNLLQGEVNFTTLTNENQRRSIYGLAPWKAMNYGIVRFNQTSAGSTHKCNAHYENNSTGYVHKYPELLSNVPTPPVYYVDGDVIPSGKKVGDIKIPGQYENTLEQNN